MAANLLRSIRNCIRNSQNNKNNINLLYFEYFIRIFQLGAAIIVAEYLVKIHEIPMSLEYSQPHLKQHQTYALYTKNLYRFYCKFKALIAPPNHRLKLPAKRRENNIKR